MVFFPLLQEAAIKAPNNAGLALIGAGLAAGLSVIGAGIGIGRLAGQLMDGMARQPEVLGKLQTAGIIFAGLIEGAALFGIVIGYLIQDKF